MKLLQTFIIILFSSVSYLSAEGEQTPNIIFILTDDQRYDEIGAVGNFPWLVTPNLDKLLKEGIYFKNKADLIGGDILAVHNFAENFLM